MKVIILCGGSGSRLWPLSRIDYPKQFLQLKNMECSIFQMTVKRALMLCPIDEIFFVTSENYKHLIIGQIEEMGATAQIDNMLFEPEPKNTLPAICFGVKTIQKRFGNDVVMVFSSDHLVDNEQVLMQTIKSAQQLAQDNLVIFGVKPDSPETAYGYIEPGAAEGIGFKVVSFHEKPDAETAKNYIKSGFFWNSGMFLFGTEVFFQQLKTHNPDISDAFEREDIAACFAALPSISIDYGLLEKSSQNVVLPLAAGWNDLGNFVAFFDKYHESQDDFGNINFQDEIILDGHDNMIYSTEDKTIAMIGLSDTVVIDQKDALLVCNRALTGKVRNVVDCLKGREDKRAYSHVTEYRPWGTFTVLENGIGYKVKRLTISPGRRLSSQLHYHRSEHWIVVSGTAKVEIDGASQLLRSGESIFVFAGKKHRIGNPGKLKLEVIEVQTGGYLEEDDIVRFEDDYSRSEEHDG